MADEALSQDEVDALLHGFSDEPATDALEPDDHSSESFNPANQEHLVRKRLRVLEEINERFIQLLRGGLSTLLREQPIVSIPTLRVIRYGKFLFDLVMPTNLNVLTLDPLHGNALVVCEPGLVFSVIEKMFGGTGKLSATFDGRKFSMTEQRIIERLMRVLLDQYRTAWQPVYPLEPTYVRSETHAKFVDIAEPTDLMIITSINVKLGEAGGDIHICVPYVSLEPIRDLLGNRRETSTGETDTHWRAALVREIQSAEVNFIATFASIPISLGQVLNMKSGDVIQFDMPKTISAEADGVPMFECRYGTSNGKYAVKIEQKSGI
jgi:flagellar motor switch protein FliM